MVGGTLIVGCTDDASTDGTGAGVPTAPTAPAGATVRYPGAEWPTANAQDRGLGPGRLPGTAAYLDDLGSSCFVVIKDGDLVGSWAWGEATAATDQEVFSFTKSLTSTLVGIAQDQGVLDIDETVSTYVHEWRGTPKETITIRNLLSMDSGLGWDEATQITTLLGAEDMRALAIGLDQQHPPGERWSYSSPSGEVLGEVLERATGRTVDEMARTQLFEPLGMTATMTRDPAGNTKTTIGWQASCLDLARFGHLLLHDGVWDGVQLVSREWLEEATSPSQHHMSPYGLMWWLNEDGRRITRSGEVVDDGSFSWPDAPPDTFSAEGFASQLLIVVPSQELVVVRLGPPASPNQPEVVGNEILRRLLGP